MDPPRAIRGTFPKSVLMTGWARDQVDCPHHPCFSPTDESQITFTRKQLRSTLELAECHLLNGLREDDISTRNCRFWGGSRGAAFNSKACGSRGANHCRR